MKPSLDKEVRASVFISHSNPPFDKEVRAPAVIMSLGMKACCSAGLDVHYDDASRTWAQGGRILISRVCRASARFCPNCLCMTLSRANAQAPGLPNGQSLIL